MGSVPDLTALSLQDFVRWGVARAEAPDFVIQQALAVTDVLQVSTYARGSQRLVLVDHDRRYAYKLACTERGEQTSEVEASGAIAAPVAPAQWIEIAGVRVLQMEYVDHVVEDDRLREIDLARYPWVPLVDCVQIGWAADGSLVCFDAGQFGEHNREIFYQRLQIGAGGR
ncbi:hypothetical protein [Mycolicibacterium peregrinum]|uniref:hypothetical protein n=1 Tax=Mycolicibacterium peregrinum TaxID=43304 RepID=UPI00104211F8|nr:hypothetical protein [Mycolicibacterium peregrinum]